MSPPYIVGLSKRNKTKNISMPPENSKKKEGVCPYRCVPSSGAQIIYIIEKT